jgi:hypothetical protein
MKPPENQAERLDRNLWRDHKGGQDPHRVAALVTKKKKNRDYVMRLAEPVPDHERAVP